MEFNAIKSEGLSGIVRASISDSSRQPERTRTSDGAVEVLALPSVAQDSLRKPLEAAMSGIQEFAHSLQRNLSFALDESSGKMVVKVTDGESGEVIRQIPSEEALRLADTLDEMRSLLFKAEA
ncbi:flagellar protein FlaG [Pseudomonas songnenensis]|jgi:flagellar protein FlaG|uniref:Flagellar protein FlaG n=1 Tax=Pseudomonas songnenensis TaxID=1176259 RepID=A0ABX9URT7_9PSED|nr:flagellar protein FlaG [Pseudomonas songnenensis]MCQ4299525.1 flagellar protein FlaG [Pseudomonas songnenensis]RMH95944.1 flagellar protein FlaG [Pseudomonas songnenensis]